MTNANPHGMRVTLFRPITMRSTGPQRLNSAWICVSVVTNARLPTYTAVLLYAARACASSRPYLRGAR